MTMVSRLSPSLLVVFMALALAGCGTVGSGKGTGLASLGKFSSSSSTQPNLLEPLGSGLLGNAASQLSEDDRRKALEAEYRTLEYSPAGKAISWSSGSASGDVMAAQPYQVGSQNCRQYTHTFSISGVPQTMRGTACRNPDGSWTPLT
ncbi:hypothetical protein KUG47_03980 [Falsochrobactrum sp. TDYN1]|uniref:Surface antigen domain-containing protein n=1 Tax=Falsochrobactrum tianjinense TaxID=2706015 RepID=A0A949PKJ6_9HYPH|nr:hypothetical protein [Falsochrobactrum sp. TDYN1]MBV2142658.1 hypothetical protein [Falsochrobactrum sp. TDYN1]